MFPSPTRSLVAVSVALTAICADSGDAGAQSVEVRRVGRVAGRFGMRGSQGGVMRGGFRLVVNVGANVRGVEFSVELDRQLGPDSKIVDGDGDVARWSEWVASIRVARPMALTRGLRMVTAFGPALLHYTASGPVDAVAASGEATRYNLGVELVTALVWHSGPLVVMAAVGATGVPVTRDLVIADAAFSLPAHIEPSAGIGLGFLY